MSNNNSSSSQPISSSQSNPENQSASAHSSLQAGDIKSSSSRLRYVNPEHTIPLMLEGFSPNEKNLD
jgi:hypothetical protein